MFDNHIKFFDGSCSYFFLCEEGRSPTFHPRPFETKEIFYITSLSKSSVLN